MAAALALAVVLALPGGGAGSPSVTAAAGLGGRAATLAAPRVDPAHPKLLDRRVQGVAFPEWAHMFGWRHTGARLDRLNGRSASTVYYAKGDKRIAYTILSGRAVPAPPTAGRATRGPVKLRTLAAGPRKVVTWTRRGHTCVLSGARVPHDVLLKLAAWRGAGAVRF